MTTKDLELLNRLRSVFKIQADERLNVITSGLIELEQTPAGEKNVEILGNIYREFHSLKGAARSVSYNDIELVCQSLENIFSGLKHETINLTSELFDTLHLAIDIIYGIVANPGDESSGIGEILLKLSEFVKKQLKDPVKVDYQMELKNTSSLGVQINGLEERKFIENQESQYKVEKENKPSLDEIKESMNNIKPKEKFVQKNDFVNKEPKFAKTVRIATDKLDFLLLEAEELLSVKTTLSRQVTSYENLKGMLSSWWREWDKVSRKIRTNRYFREKGNQNTNLKSVEMLNSVLIDFLEWNHTFMRNFSNEINSSINSANMDYYSVGGIVDNFLEDIKHALMLPVSTIMDNLNIMVRDISKAQEKEIDFVVQGSEVEIDKRILEDIKDPLIHMLRNSIDHGIEKAEERLNKKKKRRGTITVIISQISDGKVEIIVADDGAGISLDKVKDAAVNRGFLVEHEIAILNDQEIVNLIFQSELSTTPIITNMSGRGLGLSIVREKVEKLGGNVFVENFPQVGTAFHILLPVTLATFRGILVTVADCAFIIPTSYVELVTRVCVNDIKTVENRETIYLNGRTLSLVQLSDVLGIRQGKKQVKEGQYIILIVLSSGEKQIAFRVDQVMNESEILVKSLGKQLSRVRNIVGATILGNGQVVPILNIPDLIKSAVNLSGGTSTYIIDTKEVESNNQSILVVEDSITSRILLKNILESAGFRVKTAVDGMEAFSILKTEVFDLIVSDIEMPRMNGFELTTKIRAEEKLSHYPVILVTGLDSREDRERGIDVGANAYIVKSEFDQTNLLTVIRQII